MIDRGKRGDKDSSSGDDGLLILIGDHPRLWLFPSVSPPCSEGMRCEWLGDPVGWFEFCFCFYFLCIFIVSVVLLSLCSCGTLCW